MELQTVAFFTDTEHRVEPVKSGIRIVLQFDVELEMTQKGEDGNEEETEKEEERRRILRKERNSKNDYDTWMDPVEALYSSRMKIGGNAQAATDNATLRETACVYYR